MTLKIAISELYETFSKYAKPSTIITNNCISCFSKTDEDYLLNTPITKLNDHVFGSIMESCNVIPFGDKVYYYFIPRVLELTTESNFDFSFSFVEHIYSAFAKFHYKNTLSQTEQSAIDNFFHSFLKNESLNSDGEPDETEIFNIAETGFDTIPFLKNLETHTGWNTIKSNLKDYLEHQKKQTKTEEAYYQWLAKGTRKAIVDFLD